MQNHHLSTIVLSRWRAKEAIYFALCGIGLTVTWLIANLLIRDTLFMLVSLVVVFLLSYMAMQKFNQ